MIDRYSRKVMTDIWSDQKKYEIWYEIESLIGHTRSIKKRMEKK